MKFKDNQPTIPNGPAVGSRGMPAVLPDTWELSAKKETQTNQEFFSDELLRYCRELTGMPSDTTGILTSSPAWANLEALRQARNSVNKLIKDRGVQVYSSRLVMYASAEAHPYLASIAELLGLGSDSVRRIEIDDSHSMDTGQLERWILRDRAQGNFPYCVVATLGTPQSGAMDSCKEIYEVCNRQHLWLHIDARIASAVQWTRSTNPIFPYLNRADSLSLDLSQAGSGSHATGVVLFRKTDSRQRLRNTGIIDMFLTADGRNNPERLIRESGPDRFDEMRIHDTWKKTCSSADIKNGLQMDGQLAAHLQGLVEREQWLQLMSPATGNVVCFRYHPGILMKWELNEINRRIAGELEKKYPFQISLVQLQGEHAIRAELRHDLISKPILDRLVQEVLAMGCESGKDYSWSFHMSQCQIAC